MDTFPVSIHFVTSRIRSPAAVAIFDNKMRFLAVSRRFLSDELGEAAKVIGRSLYEIDVPPREIHLPVLAGRGTG